MKDRISAGFIGGLTAGLAMLIPDYLLTYVKYDPERLYNWAAVVILGRLPAHIYDVILAQAAQLFFAALIGILFSYMILKFTSGNYLFKGWLFGVTAWFTVYAVAILFRLPYLQTHTFKSSFSHLIAATVYGLVLAETLHRINPSPLSNQQK